MASTRRKQGKVGLHEGLGSSIVSGKPFDDKGLECNFIGKMCFWSVVASDLGCKMPVPTSSGTKYVALLHFESHQF